MVFCLTVDASGLLQHTFRQFPEVTPLLDVYNYAVNVISPNLRTAFTVQDAQPLAAMTRGRADFDFHLLQLAKTAGTQIRTGINVVNANRLEEGIRVDLSNGESLKSKLVIGEDSAYSTIARSFNLGVDRQSPGVMSLALEKEFPLSEVVMDQYFGKERRVSLYLNYKGAVGYGWIFPRKLAIIS